MTLVWILLALVALWLAALAFHRFVWFQRDPDHSKTAQEPRAIRSPVYGRVAYIKRIENGRIVSEKLSEPIPVREITKEDWPADRPDGDGWLIGIAMSALDVHYQYAPVPGTVGSIRHVPCRANLPMFDFWEYVRITYFRKAVQLFARRYTFENERQTMWIEGSDVKLALVLIADKFINKIATFVGSGSAVKGGEKLSFIGRGSQVDLVICGCPEIKWKVQEGQAVYGPLTILAEL